MTAYRYVGDGRALPGGVPARDLTSDDVARLPERLRSRLVPSGLYEPVIQPTKKVQEVKPNV